MNKMDDDEDVSTEINEDLQKEIDKMEWKIGYLDKQLDKWMIEMKKD